MNIKKYAVFIILSLFLCSCAATPKQPWQPKNHRKVKSK